jgi:hypothetical protein
MEERDDKGEWGGRGGDSSGGVRGVTQPRSNHLRSRSVGCATPWGGGRGVKERGKREGRLEEKKDGEGRRLDRRGGG